MMTTNLIRYDKHKPTRNERRAISAPTASQRREARFLALAKTTERTSHYALALLKQRKAARAARQARKMNRCR